MSFIMAKLHGSHVPRHLELPVADEQEFLKGALLIDEDGEWLEAAAAPFVGVALSDYGVDESGFAALGRHGFPPGRMQATIIEPDQEFHAKFSGDLPEAVGGEFSVDTNEDGEWVVDFGAPGTDVRYLGPVRLDVLYPIAAGGDAPVPVRVRVVFLPDAIEQPGAAGAGEGE